MQTHYLACDLGAESGRLVHGTIEEGRLLLSEIHRFENVPIRRGDSLHWQLDMLFDELKKGLIQAGKKRVSFASLSCDSWGLDYVLFDAEGKLISPTFHYRDARTKRGVKEVFKRVNREMLFAETGVQFIPINTIFQLASEDEKRLANAKTLLGVGDAFNFMLGGDPVIEASMASTFQLYNPLSRKWSSSILTALGLPARIFPSIVSSGTPIGVLSKSLQSQSGLAPLRIVAGCSHDTGAAVAAIPAEGNRWAYLSSGTWSLMGIERASPILSDACREMNFTNEIGYENSIRLLKNISGLWLLQEARRLWAKAGMDYDYADLILLAEKAAPFRSFIDPSDARFVAPQNMIETIRQFCRQTHQPEPHSPHEVVRCILESLALLYRETLQQLEILSGERVEILHIVGGGARNRLLNQWTANATGRRVVSGPIEATAAGNIIIQALTLGHLSDWAQARELIKNSSALESFEPHDEAQWEMASQRFESIRKI